MFNVINVLNLLQILQQTLYASPKPNDFRLVLIITLYVILPPLPSLTSSYNEFEFRSLPSSTSSYNEFEFRSLPSSTSYQGREKTIKESKNLGCYPETFRFVMRVEAR